MTLTMWWCELWSTLMMFHVTQKIYLIELPFIIDLQTQEQTWMVLKYVHDGCNILNESIQVFIVSIVGIWLLKEWYFHSLGSHKLNDTTWFSGVARITTKTPPKIYVRFYFLLLYCQWCKLWTKCNKMHTAQTWSAHLFCDHVMVLRIRNKTPNLGTQTPP